MKSPLTQRPVDTAIWGRDSGMSINDEPQSPRDGEENENFQFFPNIQNNIDLSTVSKMTAAAPQNLRKDPLYEYF